MTEDRQTWDATWLKVADAVAGRSRCDGAHVGAVIVDSKQRPVATGYNGPPRTFDTTAGPTCSSWCPRQQARLKARETGEPVASLVTGYGLTCPSVHAEANALMFADRRDYDGGSLFVTAAVCADCAKLVANSGIQRVVMRVSARDMHRDPRAVTYFLQSCGVRVEWVED